MKECLAHLPSESNEGVSSHVLVCYFPVGTCVQGQSFAVCCATNVLSKCGKYSCLDVSDAMNRSV